VEESEESFIERLRGRLAKTHDQLIGRLDRVLLRKKAIDLDVLEELEEILVTSDLGVKTSYELLKEIQSVAEARSLVPDELKSILKEKIRSMLLIETSAFEPSRAKPFVIMVVGVNGVGKTTTIGKLAARLKRANQNVMLVAADTFRAAAIEQLEIWADRVGADVIRHQANADPSAVAYDAMHAARSRGADVVIVDTAGRLHTKTNLMEELKKLQRIMDRELEGAPHEVFLVLDATTGQNAIQQARIFHEALGVTGIVLTKLDGTAKGGMIVGIVQELQLPVRFIGIGEGVEDLREFNPHVFLEAIFFDTEDATVH
jgi:fused signal recognition particle receptor